MKPFVLNNKTDAADACAICEVAGRPSTQFVPVKTVAQQDMAAWHRIRELAVKERTALVNQARALLHEQGIVIPQGITQVRQHLPRLIEDDNIPLSAAARDYLSDCGLNSLPRTSGSKNTKNESFVRPWLMKIANACKRYPVSGR